MIKIINEKSVEKIKENVNTLFLDFDDTLVDYDITQKGALTGLFNFEKLEIENYPDAIPIYTEINHRLWSQLESKTSTIDEIRVDRFHEMKEIFPLKSDPKTLDDVYLKHFIQSTNLKSGYKEILDEFQKKGYNIAITTNGIKDVQLERIEKIGILDFIDLILTSEDVGEAKPSPKMFNTAISKFDCNKDEVLVVGDSLQSDIKGALNAKLYSCWVSKDRQYNDTQSIKPDFVISEFEKIVDFFIN